MRSEDGRLGGDVKCRLDIALRVTIPTFAFDLLLNFTLTGTFVLILAPLIRFNAAPTSNYKVPAQRQNLMSRIKTVVLSVVSRDSPGKPTGSVQVNSAHSTSESASIDGAAVEMNQNTERRRPAAGTRRIKRLVTKTFVACALVLVPTTANLALFVQQKGKELGLLCLSVCTMDSECIHPLHMSHKERR